MLLMHLRKLFLSLGIFLALTAPSPAQNYPNRPITMIVPFAPGGPADVLGRLVGQKMSEDLGQQVIIDNRSGANTIVGAQFAARAQPDGYTILLAIDGTLVMNPFLYTKLAYDPFKDFEPVSLIALVPSALTANINNPANTLKEVIDIEKKKPGTFQIGVSTPTSQVAIGLLNMMAGTNMVIVPYRGGTTQITSMMAGDIPLGHESVNVALPLYRDKKVKIIALTGLKRLALAPEIPLISETFPGFDLGIWQSVVVPTGTPKPIVDRLFAALQKAMASPDVIEKLSAAGIEPTISKSPEEFGAFIKSQAEVREKVIKAVGIKID
ncbi:Bug family tripartite tricarboxylate transporter substrate binding protein [Rhodoplanes sp. Z2-YC6860]|uniref:Bug family tripartite tricarboxylate transporter substrate binding protein n=1 Tax=Rhodoplanes sp. Z2-YC6860 TaxID=674703 RepID=UPI00078D17D2|nr:tripartite tricarboxylate transporter substrate-binding protein [Rhodoplanes sp. Z2-YC6860]AMN43548.1 ABC transporter substrate-binding protein [Rhodoplanes sp. Z2-YC6860]